MGRSGIRAGTRKLARTAGESSGSSGKRLGAGQRLDVVDAVGARLLDEGGQARPPPRRVQARTSAPERISGRPSRSWIARYSRSPAAMQAASSDPGGASKPVCRIALLPFEAPSSMSAAFSTAATRAPVQREAARDGAADDAAADRRSRRNGSAGHVAWPSHAREGLLGPASCPSFAADMPVSVNSTGPNAARSGSSGRDSC